MTGVMDVTRRRDRGRWRVRRAITLDRDAVGDRATAAALARLDPERWRALAGVAWPGRPGARIDHVVVGPPGVLVIDSKDWAGALTSAPGALRQDVSRRGRDLTEAREAAGAVESLVGPGGETPVVGVLCFIPPAMVTGWVGDLLLCATGDVAAVFGRLAARLSPEEVTDVADRLEALLVPVSRPRRAESRDVRGALRQAGS